MERSVVKEEYPRYTYSGVPRMTYDLFYFFIEVTSSNLSESRVHDIFLYHFKEYTHDPVW